MNPPVTLQVPHDRSGMMDCPPVQEVQLVLATAQVRQFAEHWRHELPARYHPLPVGQLAKHVLLFGK